VITTTKPNFDRIAPFYDGLASLAFGRNILRSQDFFLNRIPGNDKVLVLGGGTGRFLLHLMKINSSCQVWYIDSSAEMIARARQKVKNSGQVHFILGTEEDIPAEIKFNAVLTFFYLDLFTEEKLAAVINKIKTSLKKDALWIVSDFVIRNNIWSPVLLKLMYSFFRLTSGVEAKKLPDWRTLLSQAGFTMSERKPFYSGFIESCIYQGAQD
jgi:tRNA (cmo5U34)-methyltransferase